MSSRQILLQQFYLETQRDDESVADYSIRIENLLRRATVATELHESVRHEMLCSKLWNGLRDPLLKNSSRYKLEAVKDFNILRRDIRSIEQDLNTSRLTTEETKQFQQNVSTNSTDRKIDNLVEQIKGLKSKLVSIEKKCEEANKRGGEVSSGSGSATSGSSQSTYTPRGRGGSYHQRGSGRGRGWSRGGYSTRRGGYQPRNQQPAKQGADKKDNPSDKEN
ncbi:MAG: hypothetical protein KZQ64_14205 [gamma proteobacterium symbiont of Bathyaustriella thionipta]|nr:hypothetical protein [gamma proteobacterium symbiont of Bathyaustriella thionipta]